MWVLDGDGGDPADSIEHALTRGESSDATALIVLENPKLDELALIESRCGLHPNLAEDLLRRRQRAKFEVYGNWTFVVLRPAIVDPATRELSIGETHLLVAEHVVIVLRQDRPDNVDTARTGLDTAADTEPRPVGIVHAVLDATVDGYQQAIDRLDDDATKVELAVFSVAGRPGGNELIERIYHIQRDLLRLSRAMGPLDQALHELRLRTLAVDEHWHAPLRDVHDHLHRQLDQLRALQGLADSAMQSNASQISQRQNDDMRKISAWAAIAAVPTMLAGVYGMNFRHMPELDSVWGYPLVLAFMAATCTTLYWRFRKAGWL